MPSKLRPPATTAGVGTGPLTCVPLVGKPAMSAAVVPLVSSSGSQRAISGGGGTQGRDELFMATRGRKIPNVGAVTRVVGDRRIFRGANGARRVPLGKEGQTGDHADAHGETQYGQVMKHSVHLVNLLVESENGGRLTCHTTLNESLKG